MTAVSPARPRRRRRAAGSTPGVDRAEPAAGDRLVAGEHLGPVARATRRQAAATSSTAPRAAVDVPEPRLAAEQHDAVAQLRVRRRRRSGARGGESTMPWSATTTQPDVARAAPRAAARPRRRSSTAAGSHWRARRRRSGGRSSRGRRRRGRSATGRRGRRGDRAGDPLADPVGADVRRAPRCAGDGQPGAARTRAC